MSERIILVKFFLWVCVFFLGCISCQSREKEANSFRHELAYNKRIDADAPLTIYSLTKKSLGLETPFEEQNFICRYFNDSLLVEGYEWSGFSSLSFRLLIIHDSVFIHLNTSGCTNDYTFTTVYSKVVLQKQKYHVEDTLRISVDAKLFYSDTLSKYYDTVGLKGTMTLLVKDKTYSFRKLRQERSLQQICQLAQGRPDTVTTLNLSYLYLDTLPMQVLAFKHLKMLDLDDNGFFEDHLDELGTFSELETLSIDHNYLKKFPEAITKLTRMRTLILSANDIDSLPPQFSKLTKLKTLHIENNDFKKIPTVLLKLPNLQELYMSGNSIPNYNYEITKLKHLKDFN